MKSDGKIACEESAGKDAQGNCCDLFVVHHTELTWREGRVESRQRRMEFPGSRFNPPVNTSQYGELHTV